MLTDLGFCDGMCDVYVFIHPPSATIFRTARKINNLMSDYNSNYREILLPFSYED